MDLKRLKKILRDCAWFHDSLDAEGEPDALAFFYSLGQKALILGRCKTCLKSAEF